MDLTSLLLIFFSIFVIVNPFGSVPIFLSLTEELSKEERWRLSKRAAAVGTILLLIFAVAGELLLSFFQITVDYLMIAGGILLLI